MDNSTVQDSDRIPRPDRLAHNDIGGATPLPLGQRESGTFYRFGLSQFATRFPQERSARVLEVGGRVRSELRLEDALADLPRFKQTSDFHCVTTWSYRAVRWEGVRFADFFAMTVLPQAVPDVSATVVALRGQDGACTGMLLADLLAPNVLLADRLNGAPISEEHGAPLRLVAPNHYGYKSVKHLSRIELRFPGDGYRVSGFRFMDHPRARVALEERGRVFPGWVLRHLYRPLIAGTVSRFAHASKNRQTL